MDKTTTWMVRIACGVVSLYLIWQLSVQTVVSVISANQRAAVAEQRLQQLLDRGSK